MHQKAQKTPWVETPLKLSEPLSKAAGWYVVCSHACRWPSSSSLPTPHVMSTQMAKS